MSLVVERPGLLSTVQDLGRFGWQHIGIVPCGAMDPESLQIANALVGNAPGDAAIEITVRGPELLIERQMLIALSGAPMAAQLSHKGGALVPVPSDRPVLVPSGSRLVCGSLSRGTRAYLAVAGGIACKPVLDSRSTYLPGEFGGLAGRALRSGDRLPVASNIATLSRERFAGLTRRSRTAMHEQGMTSTRWSVPSQTVSGSEELTVRFVDGHHAALFTERSHQVFTNEWYRIAPESNRMGYRLAGPKLDRTRNVDVLSEPTALGTVQVPADGAPIVLMADHQTTGGYAKIAEVISADMPRLAQLRPGGLLRFQSCQLSVAIALREQARQRLRTMCRSIAWEYGT